MLYAKGKCVCMLVEESSKKTVSVRCWQTDREL